MDPSACNNDSPIFVNLIPTECRPADTSTNSQYTQGNMNHVSTTDALQKDPNDMQMEVDFIPTMSNQRGTDQQSPVAETETVFKSPPPPPPQSAPATASLAQTINKPGSSDQSDEMHSSSASALSFSNSGVSIASSKHSATVTSAPASTHQVLIQESPHQLAQPQPSTSSTVAQTNQGADKQINQNDGDTSNPKYSLLVDGQQSKKRKKNIKKGAKLDVKLKLEKSRQSARECRARKKLRYQYLEDLVCNREKAVMILRDELVKFCEIAKQLDAGSAITDNSLRLVKEQAKENNHMDM